MRPPQPTCTGITRFIPGLTLISGFSPALLRTELLVAVTVFAVLVPSAMAYGTDLLDKPVLVGYIFGATLIVFGSQLGKMFGIKLESDKFFQGRLWRSLPSDQLGRIIGIVVMTAGVGLFGTLSGFLANQFLTPPKQQEAVPSAAGAGDPKAKIAVLMQMIEAQERATADLKAQLEEIDELL